MTRPLTTEEALRVLAESRTKIDAIDRQLVELLNRRTRIVEQIGRAKQAAGLPIYEPKREDDVYRNILSHNAGPLAPDALRRIYERVIDEMRSLQHIHSAQAAGRAAQPTPDSADPGAPGESVVRELPRSAASSNRAGRDGSKGNS